MNTPDTELKKWFEANYLDGDEVQECQMLASSECLDALTSRDTYWKERVESMKYDRENSLISPLESNRHEDIEYGFNRAKSILLDNLK